MAAPMRFQTRVVGWRNKREFDDVYDCLYNSDVQRQRDGLERINAWKCRFADKMPVAIECTATLLEATLMEENESEPSTLQLIYSMAVIRFVNLITGFLQNKAQAQPVVAIAKEISLPEWLVELRHEASHKHMPPLATLRRGAETGLAWLKEIFWQKQCGSAAPVLPEGEEDSAYPPNVNGVEDDINQLSIAYQQAQFQNIQCGPNNGRNGNGITEILSNLEQCLADPEAGYLLMSLLLQDGYLVPTPEQLQALGLKEGFSITRGIIYIHRALCQFWRPLMALLHSLELTPLLLQSIMRELGKFRTAESQVAAYLVGWAMQIIMAGTIDRKMFRTYLGLFKDNLQLPWKTLFDQCIQHPNCFTLDLLQYILPNLDPKMSEQAQTNLRQLMSTYRNLLESQQPVSEETDDNTEADRIYTAEDIPRPEGEHLSGQSKISVEQVDISEENQMEVIEGSTPSSFVLREKDNFQPWTKSTAQVDWSEFPIGSLPGQPDDPNFLVLDIPRSNSSKTEPKLHQCLNTKNFYHQC
ncbi:ribosomal biogenesis protein LAS1L-like isoform X2 [Patiria miniata]|uniref:Uncharacterized protein n=1 Tax=Patiria miniata TaxID=46514 RepID=A0A914BT43_PATMI|nr:ribosomal biogenesis protein LAS1L-like isoform X2 [Patiria miniata]